VESNGWNCDGGKSIMEFTWIWLGKLVVMSELGLHGIGETMRRGGFNRVW